MNVDEKLKRCYDSGKQTNLFVAEHSQVLMENVNSRPVYCLYFPDTNNWRITWIRDQYNRDVDKEIWTVYILLMKIADRVWDQFVIVL